MQKIKGSWWAKQPTDLLGWEVDSNYFDEQKKCFVLQVRKRDTREVRTVYATQFAMPLYMIEKKH